MPARSAEQSQPAARKRGLLQLEQRNLPVMPWPAFLRRMLLSLALGGAVILGSLAIGMAGYHWTEGLGGMDSFVNASMILSGMGPLWSPKTDAGKLFAGVYALYSGLAVLAVAGVIFAPLVHRMLHRFHADESDLSNQ